MSAITLKLPDELAERLRNQEDRLPEILELGLRELNAEAQGRFEGAAEVLEFLVGLPCPEEILKLRPSERLALRVEHLLEKNRSAKLDPNEQAEWENYQFLEHLVRMAKANASLKLGLKLSPQCLKSAPPSAGRFGPGLAVDVSIASCQRF